MGSFLDSVTKIGVDIATDFVKDAVSGDSSGSSSSARTSSTSGLMSPSTQQNFSQSQRRQSTPTQKAETVKEKEGILETTKNGEDAIALAKLWNDIFNTKTESI